MSLVKRGIWGLLALFLCLNVEATTYYATPAGGAAASCVDQTTNVCTLDRCITVAATGDTCELASGTYDYSTTGLVLSKNITLDSTVAGGAIITSTSTTRTLSLSAANNATPMTVGDIRVQGGASTARVIQISDQPTYDATVVINGTYVDGGNLTQHIADFYTRGTVKIYNCILSGNLGTTGGITSAVSSMSAAKKVEITGCSMDLTMTASGGTSYGIQVIRPAATSTNFWAHINNNTVSVTAPAALGASANAIGIYLSSITAAPDLNSVTTAPIIEGNTVTVTATAGTVNDTMGIAVIGTDATAVAAGAVVRNNTITCNSPVGACLRMADGTSLSTTDYSIAYSNTITSPFYNGSATYHSVILGRATGMRFYSNLIKGGGVGILSAAGTTFFVSGNVVIGSTYAPLFAKGNTSGTFANNTVIMDDAYLGTKTGNYGCMGVAVNGATNNSATTFANNACYVVSGTSWKHVIVDASQTATFTTNDYYSVPTLSSPWSYQGSAQTTLSGWQGAQESTALGVDPLFSGVTPRAVADVQLTQSSPLRRAGKDLNVGAVQDCLNRAFSRPPSIGGCEVSAAAARTARTSPTAR